MNFLIDFEDISNRYWGIPLATLDDIKSISTLSNVEMFLWMSPKEEKSLSRTTDNNSHFLFNKKTQLILNSRPNNKNLWLSQFITTFNIPNFDFFYTCHFPRTKIKSTKRIIRLHDPLSKFKYPICELTSNDKLKHKIARSLRSYAFKQAQSESILVCNTTFTASRIAEIYDISPSRLSVIPYGFTQMSDDYIKLMKRNNLQKKDYYLIVSGLRGKKRPDVIINTWARLSTDLPNLVVVGKILLQSLSQMAKNQIDNKRLILIANVTEDELNRLRINANAMIFASEYEGFGRPVIEALIAGVPSVANNLEVFAEIDPGTVDFFELEYPDTLEPYLVRYAEKISYHHSQFLRKSVEKYSHIEVGRKWSELILD